MGLPFVNKRCTRKRSAKKGMTGLMARAIERGVNRQRGVRHKKMALIIVPAMISPRSIIRLNPISEAILTRGSRL